MGSLAGIIRQIPRSKLSWSFGDAEPMRKNEQTRVCTARTTTRQATLFSSRHSAEHLRALEPFFHFVAAGVWTGTFPCNWDDGACTLDISLHFRFPLWSKSPVWRSFDFAGLAIFLYCFIDAVQGSRKTTKLTSTQRSRC